MIDRKSASSATRENLREEMEASRMQRQKEEREAICRGEITSAQIMSASDRQAAVLDPSLLLAAGEILESLRGLTPGRVAPRLVAALLETGFAEDVKLETQKTAQCAMHAIKGGTCREEQVGIEIRPLGIRDRFRREIETSENARQCVEAQ